MVVLAYVLLVGFFTTAGLQADAATAVAGTPGTASRDACPTGTAPSANTVPVKLAARGTQVESIAFGRSLSTQEREYEFALTDPSGLLKGATCIPVHVNPFLRSGQAVSAQLDQSGIHAEARVSGAQVLVVFTIARTYAGFAPAGDYAGTVSLVDPRIERVDIPLTVSMAYPVWQLPLVLLLLVLPLAVGYLWLLKGSFHSGRGTGLDIITLRQFEDYAFSRNGILAIGAGIASATLVFSATYLSSATWGVSFVDAVSLFGAMFAAFAAASTPVTASGADRSDSLARPASEP